MPCKRDVAGSSHDVTPCAPPPTVRLLADTLRMRYLRAELQVSRGMCAKPNQNPLDDIAVNIIPYQRRPTQKLELAELFAGNSGYEVGHDVMFSPCTRVQVIGNGGSGKTTVFFLKAPRDWARRAIWQNFVLVCALALRDPDVRHAENVFQLLQLKKLGIPKKKRFNIFTYIRDNPHKVCVLLDDYDVCTAPDSSEFVRGVIRGEVLKGVHLLITTHRPELPLQQSTFELFPKRVLMYGFTANNIRTYIRNALPLSCARELIKRTFEDVGLARCMALPFFTKSACDVCWTYSSIPGSVPALINAIVLNAVHKHTKNCPFADWNFVPRAMKEHVLQLGQFAFAMLVENTFVFSDLDLDERGVPPGSWPLGLLVACTDSTQASVKRWRFLAIILQECLASIYIASTADTSRGLAFLSNQLGAYRIFMLMENFLWLLSTRLSPEAKESLIDAVVRQLPLSDSQLIGPSAGDFSYFLPLSQEQLLSLAQVLSSCLEGSAIRVLTQRLREDGGLDGSVNVSEAMDEVTSEEGGPRASTSNYISALLQNWRQSVPHACVMLLCSRLESLALPMADLAVTSIMRSRVEWPTHGSCSHSATHVSSYDEATLFASRQFGAKESPHGLFLPCLLWASESSSSGVSSKSVDVHCTPSVSLRMALEMYDFDFSLGHLYVVQCRTISAVLLTYGECIRRVRLNCYIEDTGFGFLASGLRRCTKLESLDLNGTSLTSQYAEDIADVIRSNKTTLEWFGILNSPLSCTAVLEESIRCCTKLKSAFIFSKVGWFNTHALWAFTTRRYSDNVVGYYVNNFHVGDDELTRLLVSISPAAEPVALAPLRCLGLRRAGLTPSSVKVIFYVLVMHGKDIEFLDLSYNALSDALLAHITEFAEPNFLASASLLQCAILTSLDLSNTSITSESLHRLAQVLKKCSKLAFFFVDGNNFTRESDGSRQFAASVKMRNDMVEIRMPEEKLINKPLSDILNLIRTIHKINISFVP